MVYDLQSFEDFFNQFVGQFGIKYVLFGGYTELILEQANKIDYPCLMVEVPRIIEDNDGYIKFITRIYVLDKGGNTVEITDYKSRLNDCKICIDKILQFMHMHSFENIQYNPFKKEFEFIEKHQVISADDLFGCVIHDLEFTSSKPC